MKYTMTLDFIGKDSVHYNQTIEVPKEIYDALLAQQNAKSDDARMFDVGEGDINKFLKEEDKQCTAKLFRTAYGTKLLAQELQAHPCTADMTLAQKKAVYDNACLAVSKKLNHQRNVAKNFNEQLAKADAAVDKAHESQEKTIAKATEDLKKIKKDIATAKKCFEGAKLEEKLAKLSEKKAKIEARVKKAQERVSKQELSREFKGKTGNIAIGTAKNAYSSPKVAYSWCKDNGVDISFIYSKSQQKKFDWAQNTPASYWKNYPNVK